MDYKERARELTKDLGVSCTMWCDEKGHNGCLKDSIAQALQAADRAGAERVLAATAAAMDRERGKHSRVYILDAARRAAEGDKSSLQKTE